MDLPDPTETNSPVLFQITCENNLLIPLSALGHLPLMFLCLDISYGTLHLSVPRVHPIPRNIDEMGKLSLFGHFPEWKTQQHGQGSVLLRCPHLENSRVTCDWIYFYCTTEVALSLLTVFCLSDQRNTTLQLMS